MYAGSLMGRIATEGVGEATGALPHRQVAVAGGVVSVREFALTSQRELVRSLLRYPGGKTRAVSTMLRYLPPRLDTLVSPFFGGGSVELAMASQGTRVYGYDAFKPLVVFWNAVMNDADALAREVKKYHPLPKTKFYALQRSMREGQVKDKDLAAVFYTLNRSSFSGTTMSGGMSPNHERFTPSSIERLRQFKIDGLSVKRVDFQKSLAKHADDFLYCDPPYANGGALYGERGDCHQGFDHEALAQILRKRDGWILSYNDCSLVRDLYKGFKFVEVSWKYGMSNSKKSNEVLILSRY